MWRELFSFIFFITWSYAEYDDNISQSFIAERAKEIPCIFHDTKYTCDCGLADGKMMLIKLTGHVFNVSISNCRSLTIKSNALSETHGLRNVLFTNVNQLILEEKSLAFPKFSSNIRLILEFSKCNITEIQSHAIEGNIDEITFKFSSIEIIRSFAFTTLKDKAYMMKFENVIINKIEPQSFKKCSLEIMEIINCHILSDLPSRSFYELEELEFLKIHNTTFKTLLTKSLSFRTISKLVISENQFESVHGEYLDVSIKDSIIVKDNIFGIVYPSSFKGITLSKDYNSYHSENMELKFLNNSIQTYDEPTNLEFDPNFHLVIKKLIYLNNVSCDITNKLRESKYFQTFADEIYLNLDQSLSTVSDILNYNCVHTTYWIYIGLGTASILLIAILGVSMTTYYCIKRKRKRKLDIVVPEQRTYRETQIVLQIENAGLLKTDL